MLPWLRHNPIARWLLGISLFLQTANELYRALSGGGGLVDPAGRRGGGKLFVLLCLYFASCVLVHGWGVGAIVEKTLETNNLMKKTNELTHSNAVEIQTDRR